MNLSQASRFFLGKIFFFEEIEKFPEDENLKNIREYIRSVLIEMSNQMQNLLLSRYIISMAYYYRASFQWQKTMKYTIWMEEALCNLC